MSRFRDILISIVVCVICGLIISGVVVPLYIATDIIRDHWGMGKKEVYTLTADAVDFIICFLVGHGVLVMGPLLTFIRKYSWQTALIAAATNPLGFLSPFLIGLMDTDEHWYQGILNAFAWLSLPLLQCFLAMVILQALRRKRIILRGA